MTNFAVEQMEIIGDVIAFCMYGITILFLVRQRVKYRRNLSRRGITESSGNFHHELGRLVRQPATSLQTISDAEKEESQAIPTQEARQGGKAQDQGGRDAPGGGLEGDRYREVKKLAEMGLNKEEIFERVGIPKGEIDLILKLKKMSPGLQGKDRSDAPALT